MRRLQPARAVLPSQDRRDIPNSAEEIAPYPMENTTTPEFVRTRSRRRRRVRRQTRRLARRKWGKNHKRCSSPAPRRLRHPVTPRHCPLPSAVTRCGAPWDQAAFSTVYLGHDTQLGRAVAIKVLHGGTGVSQAKAERLFQEARKLARLQHPGIVTVHDVGTQDGQVFIISSFLDGRDLSEWLKQYSPSWQDAAKIAASVADALAHAHSHLTIHRDVKPANIILTLDGEPVLVDFGLALDESEAGGRRTRPRLGHTGVHGTGTVRGNGASH